MSSVAQRLMTAEEYWQSPRNGKQSELIQGEVVERMPPGARHGEVAVAIAALLKNWSKQGTGGYVGTESGFILVHSPDTVRSPHVSYVRPERIPGDGVPEAFWAVAPDLAVEVISPSETADDIQGKVREYLSAGTPLVWVVYPRRSEAVIYAADGLGRTYTENDVLEFPDVLPGFSCRVAELFA
jgi:Uma2 family endonuclease